MTDPTPVSLVHLGCARNLIDSELILGRLADEGLAITGDPALAHTVVLNTCSFIGPARAESEQAINDLIARKQRGEIERVVVAGCLVQSFKRELTKRFPDVDMFAEISDGKALAKGIRRMARGHSFQAYLESPGLREAGRDGSRLLSTPRSFAYLRISHGCDHTCSFCAIPGIRGTHRSKRPGDLVAEARELIDMGVRELVLVAEDSTAWGRDMDLELPSLVEALAELDGDHRLRVMYAYPNNFPWELTTLLREHPRVIPYLDMPVQHIATPVLRAMRRAGSGDQVRRLIDRLRDEVPNLTLRTTLLLGFPGETDADAAEVPEFVRTYELGRVGAFVYSPEQNTPSFGLPDQVPEEVAEERYFAVIEARDEVLRRSQEALIGRELDVLVDEPGASGNAHAVGRTDMDAPEVDLVCKITDCDAAAGDVVRVRVAAVEETSDLVAAPVREVQTS